MFSCICITFDAKFIIFAANIFNDYSIALKKVVLFYNIMKLELMLIRFYDRHFYFLNAFRWVISNININLEQLFVINIKMCVLKRPPNLHFPIEKLAVNWIWMTRWL